MQKIDFESVRKILILNEIEYCFDVYYPRHDEVRNNEYSSLKREYDFIMNSTNEELIEYFGMDLIEHCHKGIGGIKFQKKDSQSFIDTCMTATDEDKENALKLLNSI